MSSESAAEFNIHDAKSNWSRIAERVESGDEIVICRAGNPVVKVVPLRGQVGRTARGWLRGKLVLAPDWDSAAVNEAIASDFGR
jgi:prevent-host-death family protein